MRQLRLAACAIALAAALSAAAQEASPFGEVVEVRVTNVEVVVTDRSGEPVTGLTPADFEIYENGKKQELSNFAEYGGQGGSAVLLGEGAAPLAVEPAPPSPRKFIFYFDDATLEMANRHAVYPGVRKFLAANMRKGDQAMVVTWNRELHVRVPWTRDPKVVDRALEIIAGEAPASSVLRAEKTRTLWLMNKLAEEMSGAGNSGLKPTWEEIENAALSYAERYLHDVTRSTKALTRLLASLAGVEGRKVLVMATQTLPTVAGAELFEHYENLRSSANSGVVTGGRDSRLANFGRFNVQDKVETLARAANAAGVTIYGINPKGLDGDPAGNVERQNPVGVNVDFAESVQAFTGINLLAERTGGVAMVGAPADLALARVGRDLDAYYSLGYRSAPGAAVERKIEVRAKRPGLRVRSRKNVYYRSLEREMADRVIANHLQGSPPNELGVSIEADPVKADGSKRVLPMRVVIPVEKLTLLPDAKGNLAGGFSVFTCSGDGEGATSGVNVQSQAIHFTPAQAEQMKGRRIGFAIEVPLEKGKHQVSIGVVDHVSQGQGFARMKAAL